MPSNMTLISTQTVSGSSTSAIEFLNIPATYNDLCLKLSIRHATAGGEDTPFIRFNNDSSSNYNQVFGSGRGTGTPTTSSGGTTATWVGTVPGAGDTSGAFSNIEIFIPNYANTSHYKSCWAESTTGAATASMYIRIFGSTWQQTVAISRITVGVVSAGYNIDVNSTAYLYGIKNS